MFTEVHRRRDQSQPTDATTTWSPPTDIHHHEYPNQSNHFRISRMRDRNHFTLISKLELDPCAYIIFLMTVIDQESIKCASAYGKTTMVQEEKNLDVAITDVACSNNRSLAIYPSSFSSLAHCHMKPKCFRNIQSTF